MRHFPKALRVIHVTYVLPPSLHSRLSPLRSTHPAPCSDPHIDLLIELFMSGMGGVAACCSFKELQSYSPAAATDGEVIHTQFPTRPSD